MSLRPQAIQHFNSAAQLIPARRFDEAAVQLRHAVRLDPDFIDARYYLGLVERELGRREQAIEQLEAVLRLDAKHDGARRNLGSVLNDAAADLIDAWRIDEAAAILNRAESLDANSPQIQANLGTALLHQARPADAEKHYRMALAREPDRIDTHWGLAHALLMRGDFAQGLAEYEWRWKWNRPVSTMQGIHRPRWDGSDPAGKTLLVPSDQALGDMLHFCRYVPLLAQRGARVTIVCQPELVRIMQRVPGVSSVSSSVPADGYDLCAPAGSLPYLFQTRLQSVPANVPYLSADPELAAAWAGRLPPRDKRIRVGLCWSGNPMVSHNPVRAVPVAAFAELATSGAEFYGLQKGPAPEGAALPAGLSITPLGEQFADFADTAAVIANLDLIITVDTSVVHLAGAMGKPTWLLLPYCSTWRWMLGRDDSPWYPSVRLFRQPTMGDWKSVMERVSKEMRAL